MVEAEKTRDALVVQDEAKSKKADIYMKIMHKIISEGEVFIDKELKRVKKIMDDGKISDAKKKQLEQRINILKSFTRQKSKSKNELWKFFY